MFYFEMKKVIIAAICLAAFATAAHFSAFLQPEVESRKSPVSGARKSLEFFSDVRSYPEADIPETGMAPAFAQLQQQQHELRLTKNTNAAAPGDWRAIGPHNIGGRTLALALNPMNTNTLYAGSASGGLWRSYSGGKGASAWKQVRTGFPVLAVSSIAIAPEDSNVIYIGTGEMYGNPVSHPGVLGERLNRGSYGIGVLKSTDGGFSWASSLDWLYNQRRAVQMVQLNPKRAATVWAATTEGTFRSYDAGASWQKVHDVVMATDLVISPLDTNIVIVGCGGMGSPGHGLYRSTDAGQSWEQAQIPGVSTFNGKIRLSLSLSSPQIIAASIGRNNGSVFFRTDGTWLVKSLDSGDSWEVVSTQDYSSLQGWYSHDVAIHPADSGKVWTAGQPSTLYFSDNGGSNLDIAVNFGLALPHAESQQLGLSTKHADYHHIVFSPTDPEVIYFASDGGIFLSEDGGKTLQNCNRGYQTTQFYNGSSSSETDSLFALAGTQDNGSYAYEGDLFWRFIFGGDGGWTAMNQENNNRIFYSWQWLHIVRSLDKANFNSFPIWPPNDEQTTNFIAPFILSPADNSTLYAASIFVFKRTSGTGATWEVMNNGLVIGENPAIAMVGSYQTADVLYIATSPGENSRGNIYKTEDGGVSWQMITQNLPDRFITDLAVDPEDDRRIFVALGGFGVPHLYNSDDGGETWQDIGSDLPDVPAWSVVVDPDYPQQLFAGNDLGIYFSSDNGETWQPHMVGLSDAVMAMDLTVSWSNRTLRMATHGNGFYESKLPTPEPTSVAASDVVVPGTIVLEQNYPNPFNPETRIRYYLQAGAHVELSVYNLRGQLVRNLVSERQQEGRRQAVWDGYNAQGKAVASGVYLYRLSIDTDVFRGRMTLLR